MRVAVAADLVKLLGFFLDVDAEKQSHQPHGQQNAADTKRIGHGVAHPHLIDGIKRHAKVAQDLLPGPQRRRVGYRAGEDTEHHGKRDIEQFMQDRGDQAAENDDQNSEEVQPQAGDAQRGEEARPHLNTDGIHEENQAKFLNKVQHRAAERNARLVHKVADDNTAKQHASDTEADAAHFYIADPQSDDRHQRQYANGQCYITHRLFPVYNITHNEDYDRYSPGCMPPGAQ